MGTESSSAAGAPKNISRRRVVAGAAWSVPAVMVASAAPAVAASRSLLSFTGDACKLPGNSQDVFKGYVFELLAQNPDGGLVDDAVIVITSVTINGTPEPIFGVQASGQCGCGPCAGAPAGHTLCVPDDTEDMVVTVATGTFSTSENAEMVLTYQLYDCACTPIGAPTTITSGVLATPPVQNQQQCKVTYPIA